MKKYVLILGLLASFSAKSAIIASGDDCGDNCHWEIDENGVLTISGEGSVNGYGPDAGLTNTEDAREYVKERPWQEYNNVITSIEVGNGLTSLGNRIFEFMDNVESVKIADSVSFLGTAIFGFMSNLTDVKMPDGLQGMSYLGQFNYDTKLKNVECSESSKDLCMSIQFTTFPSLIIKNNDGSESYYQYTDNNWTLSKTKNKRGKRIYTVEEASRLSKETGNTFKLRYK